MQILRVYLEIVLRKIKSSHTDLSVNPALKSAKNSYGFVC